MTKNEALKILIESSCKDIIGQGLGYRSTTEAWREKVKTAVRKMYPYAYDGQEVNEFNLF